MKNSPRKSKDGVGCPDRYVGCHSKCEKYLEWKAYIDQTNANRWAYMESKASTYGGRTRKK